LEALFTGPKIGALALLALGIEPALYQSLQLKFKSKNNYYRLLSFDFYFYFIFGYSCDLNLWTTQNACWIYLPLLWIAT